MLHQKIDKRFLYGLVNLLNDISTPYGLFNAGI